MPQTYADWKAPRVDGEVLVWPAPAEIARAADATRARLGACTAPFGATTVGELRAQARAFFGVDEGKPYFVTGHQVELYHPGVWVKNVLVARLAEKLGGRAAHVAVDTDAPKHLALKLDGRAVPLTDDPDAPAARWAGRLDAPSPAQLRALEGAYAGSDFARFGSPLPEVLSSLRTFALEGHEGTRLPEALLGACHALDWSLGLDYAALPLSPALAGGPWLAFVAAVLGDLPTFAARYNRALIEFRAEHGIKGTQRPMPDLKAYEAPFWLDELDAGKRHRLALRDGRLWANGDSVDPRDVDALRAFLRQHALRVSPRALTLTMFLRLFVADVFVHGIGGGRYDQVLDKLVRAWLNVEPPAFAVATATLFAPRALGQERVCLPCLAHEGHQLRHRTLGKRKAALVSAIADAPRKSFDRAQRFSTLRAELARAARTDARYRAWRDRFERGVARAGEEKFLFDRELFYALQPRARLEGVIANVAARF